MSYCTHGFKKEGSGISFPCGKCLDCRMRRASSWGFRMAEQLKCSDTAYFLTLTYSSDFINFCKRGRTTLHKKDVQLFLKKLRKKQPTNDIKYYLAGEYGEVPKMRPHYHIIIFNLQLTTLFHTEYAKMILSNPTIYMDGYYEHQAPIWGKGHITIGTVTHASINYSIKYLSKKKQVPQYKGDYRTPEFSLMSKGIGANYLSNAIINWHKSDSFNRMYVNYQHYKIAMPRYYKEKLYNQSEREKIAEHIINKQKQKRKNSYRTKKLTEKLQYIQKTLASNKNKDRILNSTNKFKTNIL